MPDPLMPAGLTPPDRPTAPSPLHPLEVGDVVELQVGPVAHGGHCVARHEGRVVFVRHTLPGEVVRARVTQVRSRSARADAVEILIAAPDRVPAPCRFAGPGACGGCDWQHVSPAGQRRLKAAVVIEQLVRLGGFEAAHPLASGPLSGLSVEEVPGGRPDGTGWRTRVQFSVDRSGRLGLRRHRSHDTLAVDRCLLAADGIDDLTLTGLRWPGWARVEAVVSGSGERLVVLTPAAEGGSSRQPGSPGGKPSPGGTRRPVVPALPAGVATCTPWGGRGRGHVREPVPTADGQTALRVSGTGFWQVHAGAPAVLVDAVLDQVRPRPGQRILDLYSGVGLFGVVLGAAVGGEGEVIAVESDETAVRDARRNLHALPQVRCEPGRVEQVLPQLAGPEQLAVDAVVLDPPRAGANRPVVDELSRLRPAVVCYVACDPASLARDAALLRGHGYQLTDLRAFDLFPHTQHVECVARFSYTGSRLVGGREEERRAEWGTA